MAYRPTHTQPLGTTALTTTPAEVWDPGSGRALLLYEATLAQTVAGTVGLLVHLTNGTAAASGTIGTFVIGADEQSAAPVSFGAGKQLTKGNKLGLKTHSGAGTVAGLFTGRYVY